MRSIVIHGHFYQPPRDDPWTGAIPLEPNAAPFHDWNERIERECYARVAASLASMSFDFGPTLLEWMEQHAPGTYAAVVAAGRAGGAVAMPYHQLILPLSARRDKVTEVRWGIADFRRRFGREPEGMWLPETAVDDDTLDVLAAAGIRFTILAPHQVQRAPEGGLPGWYRTGGGRRIAVFIYDGAISHDVAFGPLVRDAVAWVERLTATPNRLVAVATDGETYGTITRRATSSSPGCSRPWHGATTFESRVSRRSWPGTSPRRKCGSSHPARGAVPTGWSAGAPSAAVAPRRSAPRSSAGARRCVRPSTGSRESCTPCSSARVELCPRSSSARRSACLPRAAGSSTTSPGSSR